MLNKVLGVKVPKRLCFASHYGQLSAVIEMKIKTSFVIPEEPKARVTKLVLIL